MTALQFVVISRTFLSVSWVSRFAGRYFVCRVSCSHVCSSGGSQRRPSGRVQHGKHSCHHALQARVIYFCTMTHSLISLHSVDNSFFFSPGSTSTAPVGPPYPPHWRAMRLNKNEKKNTTPGMLASQRPGCLKPERFTGSAKKIGFCVTSNRREGCEDEANKLSVIQITRLRI